MRTDANPPKLKDLKNTIAKNNCKKLIDFADALKGEIAYTAIDAYERVYKWTVEPEGNGGLPQEERLLIFEMLFSNAFRSNENFILRAASADEKSFRVFGFRARGESGNVYDIPADLLESMVTNREADAELANDVSVSYETSGIEFDTNDPKSEKDWREYEQTLADTKTLLAKCADKRIQDLLVPHSLDSVFLLTRVGDCKPWESKIGGLPYLPKGETPPEGKWLLAQLNLDDMPKQDGFPNTGILQFWLANDESGDNGFLVKYIETYERDESKLEDHVRLPENADDYVPFSQFGALSLLFQKGCTYLGISGFLDVDSNRTVIDDYYTLSNELPPKEDRELWMLASACGCHVGGHAFFPQGPMNAPFGKDTVVLLQIDSGRGINIVDNGTMVFSISKEDLANCDFSKVAFSISFY